MVERIEVECPPGVREGLLQMQRGDVLELTDEETERYLETGELPERAWRWADERERRG